MRGHLFCMPSDELGFCCAYSGVPRPTPEKPCKKSKVDSGRPCHRSRLPSPHRAEMPRTSFRIAFEKATCNFGSNERFAAQIWLERAHRTLPALARVASANSWFVRARNTRCFAEKHPQSLFEPHFLFEPHLHACNPTRLPACGRLSLSRGPPAASIPAFKTDGAHLHRRSRLICCTAPRP